MTREAWIRQAIALATENVSLGRGGPFGAIVVKENRLIATGVNRVTATNDPTAHAEIMAIRAACSELATFQLQGCELYLSCEPCPMCLGAIYWARPSFYCFASTRLDAAAAGFDDALIYNEIALAPERRTIPGSAIQVPESSQPFIEWLRSSHKLAY
jgi:guanine deaminase